MRLRPCKSLKDSFVQVLMDDRPLEKCKTTVARAKSEPMWIYNCEVEIMAPMSMWLRQRPGDVFHKSWRQRLELWECLTFSSLNTYE